MIALVPVRDGVLPAGADEAIAECGGRGIFVGSGLVDLELQGLAVTAHTVELGDIAPGRWSAVLPTILESIIDGDEPIVLPNSPDGRDLAPRLAAAMHRPLLAGATTVSPHVVRVARRGGLELHELHPDEAFVATLQPGVRGAELFTATVEITQHPTIADGPPASTSSPSAVDARIVEVLPPDVRTMDLSEARRIVGGGAGLDSAERFAQLDAFAVSIDGVMGATRVITDRHWVHHDRQIGTTGVVVAPSLYVSFGVSGAVQHTSGLGAPDNIISVNTDPHCPMMAMSDLAIVADANATLEELLALLAPDDATRGAPGAAMTKDLV